MKRIVLSLCILGVLLALCTTSVILVRRACRNLLAQTDAVLFAMAESDDNAALAAVDALNAHWEKSEGLLNVLVQSDKLREIRTALVRLRPLLEAGSDEPDAELATIRAELTLLYESELPLPVKVL